MRYGDRADAFLKLYPAGTDEEASASQLAAFRDELASVEVAAVYYHLFEARRRGRQSFDDWFEALGETALAEQVRRVHPYTSDLEGLRARLLQLCDAATAADQPEGRANGD